MITNFELDHWNRSEVTMVLDQELKAYKKTVEQYLLTGGLLGKNDIVEGYYSLCSKLEVINMILDRSIIKELNSFKQLGDSEDEFDKRAKTG